MVRLQAEAPRLINVCCFARAALTPLIMVHTLRAFKL